MINRLIDFEGGDITIDGRSVRSLDVTQLRRGIGYVIQQIGLFPHMTIEANIGTVPRLLGWDRDRIRRRARELIELVGLDPDRDARRYPAQLSGGQRQRVGLARALAADPPVMLMDEPFGALDPITRERLQNEFLRLHRQLRKTVIFVTHDIDEAIKMGDKIAILREGGVLADSGPVIPNFGHGSTCVRDNHTFCWGWVKQHWSDTLGPALVQHIVLTLIAVGIGFVISLACALIAHRHGWFERPFDTVSGI